VNASRYPSAVAIAPAPTRPPLEVARFRPLGPAGLEALEAELAAVLAEHRALARELHAEIVAHCRQLREVREEREALLVDLILGLR
jgi:hypothetical protein